jgi:tellurite methyltransferase
VSPERFPVSPLFSDHRDAVRTAARLGPIVDLACGRGRHALALQAMDLPVVALDRNDTFLRTLAPSDDRTTAAIARLRCDLETEYGLPFRAESCGAILVFRFLYRPLCAAIADALAPGGLLLYETFTLQQRTLDTGPQNPDFLLAPSELPDLFPELDVLSHVEGFNAPEDDPAGPPSSATARLAARKPSHRKS